MRGRAISILASKDLFLIRHMIWWYLTGGIISTLMAAAQNFAVANAGLILMLTTAISFGIHLIGELLLEERKNDNLAFVLSLPVTYIDYSFAKMGVLLLAFLVPWGTMFAGSLLLVLQCDWIPDGRLPFTMLVFLELLAAFCVQLATAFISRSIGWTMSMLVVCNVFLNLFLIGLLRQPEVAAAVKSETPYWTPLVTQVAACEIAVIACSLLAGLVAESRKRDYL